MWMCDVICCGMTPSLCYVLASLQRYAIKQNNDGAGCFYTNTGKWKWEKARENFVFVASWTFHTKITHEWTS